ncbi:putative Diguanylate cyclase [Candidatus Magnetomoraceae bacterium gMMP-15]
MTETNYHQNIQLLAETVINALKDLLSKGEGLSISSLLEIFENNQVVKELLGITPSSLISQTDEYTRSYQEIQDLKSEIYRLNSRLEVSLDQKARLEKSMTQFEDKSLIEKDFFKRSILSFISLLRTPNNEAYFEALDQYKELLLQEAEIDYMETPLKALKNIAMQEDKSSEPDDSLSEKYDKLQEEFKRLTKQAEIAVSQRDRLEKSLSEFEEKEDQKLKFNKRALLLLMGLLRIPENKAYFSTLDKLKKLIVKGAEIEDMDKLLGVLQNLSFQEESADSFEDEETSDLSLDDFLELLKEVYLDFLNGFQANLGEDYLKRLSDVQTKIYEADSIEAILSIKQELIALVNHYIQNFDMEIKESDKIMSEIGGKLVDLETSVASSIADTRKVRQGNKKFNENIQNQMEEIKGSVNLIKTLSDLKKLFFSRLFNIKSSFEKKFKDDESLMENTDENMMNFQKNLSNMQKEISQVRNRTKFLEHELLIDPLTGIYNRRAYEIRISDEMKHFIRRNSAFSLIIFDISNFKRINNNYGHTAGDKALKHIAKKIKKFLRKNDFFARYGSDEFILLLSETEDKEACEAGEYLIELVQKTKFSYKNTLIPLNISVGVTQSYPFNDENTESIFNRGYMALGQAKKSRAKKVVCARRSGINNSSKSFENV